MARLTRSAGLAVVRASLHRAPKGAPTHVWIRTRTESAVNASTGRAMRIRGTFVFVQWRAFDAGDVCAYLVSPDGRSAVYSGRYTARAVARMGRAS